MNNFQKVLDILREGRGNPLERKHYKVKFDRDMGYYTIVGGSTVTHRGIKTKEEAEKICKEMNDEL